MFLAHKQRNTMRLTTYQTTADERRRDAFKAIDNYIEVVAEPFARGDTDKIFGFSAHSFFYPSLDDDPRRGFLCRFVCGDSGNYVVTVDTSTNVLTVGEMFGGLHPDGVDTWIISNEVRDVFADCCRRLLDMQNQ